MPASDQHPQSPQNQWPTRKSLRLLDYDYSQPGHYFITICTEPREPWFGTLVRSAVRLNPLGRIVQTAWRDLPDQFPGIQLDQYMIMPDHIHGLIALTEGTRHRQGKHTGKPTLGNVVGTFKSTATSRIRWRFATNFAWQQGFNDVIIRDEQMLDRIRQYIATNPVRWMLKHNDQNQ